MSEMDYQWVEDKLTDIHDKLERLEAMIPKSVSSSSAVEPKNKGDGMTDRAAIYRSGQSVPSEAPQEQKCTERESRLRTERVALEVTYDCRFWNEPSSWAWNAVLKQRTNAVRVVEEPDFLDMAQVMMERDAAIRDRDEAKQHHARECAKCSALADKVIALRARVAELEGQLESVACRAATAETALESAAKLAPPANADAESNHATPAASVVLDVITDMTDILRINADPDEQHAALATLVEAVCPGWRLAPAASGAAGTEPLAWGVKLPGHETFGQDAVWSVRPSEKLAKESFPSLEGWVHFPLYAAPQPAKGWLTAEERGAVEEARDFFNGDNEESSKVMHRMLSVLLARSSPPEVVLPTVFQLSDLGHPLVALEQVKAA